MRSTRRARLVLTILLLTAFTLITLDYRTGSIGGVRRLGSTVFGPIEGAVSHVTHPVGSWLSAIGHLGGYKSDNANLKKQVTDLQRQLHLSDAEHSQLTQLQKLVKLDGEAQYPIVAARVTAIGSGFEYTATINRGSANGIKPNETVINGDGLVGRITSVGRTSATILLANDPTSVVGARLEGTGDVGRLTGGGRDALSLQLFDSNAKIAVGDRLVTFGSTGNRPFVPEIPLGHVVSVSPASGTGGRLATVVPYVNYTAIDVVAVVVGSPTIPKHDSLLPPSPSPTPRPTVTVTVTATPGSKASDRASGNPSATP